jgi:hypothetical protein
VKRVHGFWEGEEDGTFRVPKDRETCGAVTLLKSKDAKRPENYRPVMKLVVQQKLVLVIIGQRLQRCIGSAGKKHECQNGFRFGRGIIDAVFNSRLFLKKRKERGVGTWVLFLDLVKAFDTISREVLWDALRLLGCPTKFVLMIKPLHGRVIIALKKGAAVLEVESLAGARQGGILGPPLLNFHVVAVMLAWGKVKEEAGAGHCALLTGFAGSNWALSGIPSKTAGGEITVDHNLHAEDTAVNKNTKADVATDSRLLAKRLVKLGSNVRQGVPGGKRSKTECLCVAKQPTRCLNPATFGGVDSPPFVVDEETGAAAPHAAKQHCSRKEKNEEACHFQCLGSLTDSELNDLIDVKHRTLKSPQNFGRFRVPTFCDRKFSRRTKLAVCRAIFMQAALHGRGSWGVTAEIERHLEGSQHQQLEQVLGTTTTQQIDERISKAQSTK